MVAQGFHMLVILTKKGPDPEIYPISSLIGHNSCLVGRSGQVWEIKPLKTVQNGSKIIVGDWNAFGWATHAEGRCLEPSILRLSESGQKRLHKLKM